MPGPIPSPGDIAVNMAGLSLMSLYFAGESQKKEANNEQENFRGQ